MKRKYYKRSPLIGIYPRKLIFFTAIFSLAVLGYSYYKNNNISADSQSALESHKYQNPVTYVEVLNNGKVLVDGQEVNDKINYLENGDELRLKILDNPPSYLSNLTVELKLPSAVASKTEHKILAIHGVDQSYSGISDASTIIYSAQGISKTATISVVAVMPKGTINKNIFESAISWTKKLDFNSWIYFLLIIPVIAFIGMLVFIRFTYKINRVDFPNKAISSPPMAIPPALVGVLYHQRVTSREIAATLVDLALRKDIYILDKERGFAFGKGRFDQRLLGYEKMLLSKIFKNTLTSTQSTIQQKVQNQIYSKKVSLVSAGIYGIATRLGYFRHNPRKIHAKYWLFGSFAMIIGLAGFAASFIIKILPSFTAFFWVGMMFSALIIIIMSTYIPLRTELGNEALSNWLAFRKFLSDPNPIEYSPTVFQLFELYLPYAIVLDCEAAWSRRFSEHPFIIPDWFVTDKNGLGINDFCLALFPIVTYVGRSLAAMKEPGFE